jgi:hypothetical protein
MVNAAQELAQRAVSACAEHYKFDAEEAIGLLGLNNVKLERKSAVKDEEVKEKVVIPKPKFPLPYNGELNDTYCYALRQNNGLYTQCLGVRKGEAKFCKSCAAQMLKRGEDVPEYGTIQQRQAVGILEYVDPKGRKPIAYTKLMKKYKISQQDVVEEAGKLNITINEIHFRATTEEENKRGRRPKNQDKEEKVKGVKGRPKKEKSVILIEGDDDDDLFAALVEEANAEEHTKTKEVGVVSNEEESTHAKDELSEEEQMANEFEKIELEARKQQDQKEREEKKEQERLEREAKKKAEEEEKTAKKEQEKEAKKKKSSEDKKEEETETDVVKKIVYDGKKYLQSKKTGIIYDYNKYVTDGDQVKVGMWNATTEKIDYYDDEESEEEYDEDEE